VLRSDGWTVDVEVNGLPGEVTVAQDRAGRLLLIDARVGQHGSLLSGLFAAWSEAATAALRAGAPLAQVLPPAEAATAMRPLVRAVTATTGRSS
jgi:hypothetical protein